LHSVKDQVFIHGMSIYRRTLAYFRPFLGQSLFATALMLLIMPLNLLKPWPFAYIVGEVLPSAAKTGHPLSLLGFSLAGWSLPQIIGGLCIFMVVLQLITGWLNLVGIMIFVRIGLQGLLRLRTELYAYLHMLPLKFHDQRRSADSSFRVAYDSQSVQTFYSRITFIFQTCITLASTFAAMCWLDWELTLLSLLVIPFMILTFRIFATRIRNQSTVIAERESAVLTAAQEGLSSVRMVQAFGREEYEVQQFGTSARGSLEANIRLQGISMKSSLMVSILMALATAAIYYIGSTHYLSGVLSLKGLIAISTYLITLYQPLEALTQVGWALEGAAAGAQRCFEVLDKEDEVCDAPNAEEITSTRGEITFEKVEFNYDNTRPILNRINVHVASGETVAFVGGTGAGKTTLLSLVPRFYDPTGGRVLIDGKDLKAVKKKSLRNQMSIVLQDTLLFSTTIRENIAYGRPDATEEEIIEAAKRAQAHDFIMQIPSGYQSQVGERGGHLSVGQRQRLGIARAFLKNAPILLLDEPTSALDPTTEAAIMLTIKELMKGRTTLIITHRIATVHDMEKIVVLKNGEVVEVGKGDELVARNGAYAQLYHSANLD